MGVISASLSGSFFISTLFIVIFLATFLCRVPLSLKPSFIFDLFPLLTWAIECFRTQPLT